MHISDWFPTLLHVAGVSDIDGTKPLDGVNVWEALSTPGGKSTRNELLHNVNPYHENLVEFNENYSVDGWNTTVGSAALRSGKWKILTGDPSTK